MGSSLANQSSFQSKNIIHDSVVTSNVNEDFKTANNSSNNILANGSPNIETNQKLEMLSKEKGLPVKHHSQVWEDKQKYTLENDKYIRIRRKYKIVNDGIKYKELKCKDEIINLKKGYSAMIKTLNLINIKEYIKLIYVDDNKTELDIKSKITISIPNKEDFENYIKLIFQNILDNLVNKLLKPK